MNHPIVWPLDNASSATASSIFREISKTRTKSFVMADQRAVAAGLDHKSHGRSLRHPLRPSRLFDFKHPPERNEMARQSLASLVGLAFIPSRRIENYKGFLARIVHTFVISGHST